MLRGPGSLASLKGALWTRLRLHDLSEPGFPRGTRSRVRCFPSAPWSFYILLCLPVPPISGLRCQAGLAARLSKRGPKSTRCGGIPDAEKAMVVSNKLVAPHAAEAHTVTDLAGRFVQFGVPARMKVHEGRGVAGRF